MEHIDGARALVELRGYSDYSLAMEIAGLGGDVVVVSVDDASLQVRARLRDIGDALCQMYHSVT